MAKITLDSITSGFKSVAKLIANFTKIEDTINDKVLFRDNPDGEANQMQTGLDMNSQRLYNLAAPTDPNDAARYADITGAITTTDTIIPSTTGNSDKALSNDGAGTMVWRDGDDLGFNQDVSGSVRRTLGDKLRESVSVEDFGAVGDGVTDDITAINAALVTGKTVTFQGDKNYRVSGIPIFSGQILVCNGATITIDDGNYNLSSPVEMGTLIGGLTIAAGTRTFVSSTTAGTVTGSTGAWTRRLLTSDTGTVATGDVIKTGFGPLRVTGVSTNTYIDVLDKDPAASLAGVDNYVYQYAVQINLPFNVDGFVLNGGSLTTSGSIVIDGDDASTSDGISVGFATLNIGDGLGVSNFASALSVAGGRVTGTLYVAGSGSAGISAENGANVELTFSCYSSKLFGIIASTGSSVAVLGCDILGYNTGVQASSSSYIDVTNGTLESNRSSSTAITAQLATVKAIGTDITGGGITTYGYGNVLASSCSITSAPVALTVQDSGIIDATGATLTTNTVNYSLSQNGSITDATGVVLRGESSYTALVDGTSTPTTKAGTAYLYADTADGDLKVKFGDGTVVRLATDSQATQTVTDSTDTIGNSNDWVVCNRAGTITLTLPTASDFTGRQINIKTIQAQQVVSNSSDVVPLTSDAAGTAILAATDGAWATLRSDGTNWVVFQAG